MPVATPTVSMPGSGQPGHVIDVTYRFAVASTAPPFDEDYTVFVHAVDEGGTRLWTDDHQPPRPTRGWKAGTVVDYTRSMLVRQHVPKGAIGLEVGLYSTESKDRLRLSGEDAAGKRTYRVGAFRVTPGTTERELYFVNGFHNAETPEDDAGLEWRWSMRSAMFGLRHPKRDARLVVVMDQPIKLSTPQRVDIYAGAEVIDTFTAQAGPLIVRKIPVSMAQLGDLAIPRFRIAVDRSFVPANLRELGSSDRRELGIRLFSAYFEPLDEAPAQ